MIDETPRTHSTHRGDPADLVGLLHARGQRATPQRLVILRELRRRGRHATAEEIGQSVRDELPGTSMPTVYAALDLLVELGLVRRIDTGAGPALYDAGTEPHQHTVCRRCGRVDDLDFELDADALRRASGDVGFTAQSIEIIIAGVCPDCAAAPPVRAG
jgi:Fur family transcriptional regulator, stress-responsive regulator